MLRNVILCHVIKMDSVIQKQMNLCFISLIFDVTAMIDLGLTSCDWLSTLTLNVSHKDLLS